jgi:hypothetical protein
MPRWSRWLGLSAALVLSAAASAAEPLHKRIDALIAVGARGQPASARADDAEFLRRVYLDLAGRIPSVAEARAFLQDKSATRRAQLIDKLLASPDYPRRMQELFHAMLMERLGDHSDWTKYLQTSFATNKPWDALAREILRAAPRSETARGAAFFYAKRLENYGQNPVDYAALTRDVGRLFLGVDLRCAQCHDHLFIAEYKQQDFQGLYAFFQNTYLLDVKSSTVGEKPTTRKVAYMSVFKKVEREMGPRLPGRREIPIPELKKGEEFTRPLNRKDLDPGQLRFSPLEKLAEELPTRDSPGFVRNAVNRLWWVMMGRGLVHPLDLHHADNPPSHPELLDLLAQEFVAHHFDIKWLLRELALSETYQRSSLLPAGKDKPDPDRFLTAIEKRMSAEQLMWATLEALGERERLLAGKSKPPVTLDSLRTRFVKAFANPAREAETEFAPSLKGALFVLNDDAVMGLLTPREGNLMDRLDRLADADKAIDELYLSVLSREPTAEEKADAAAYLKKHETMRSAALGRLAWSLLASTEFCVNH